MKLDRKWFVAGILAGLFVAAVAGAVTVDQIWTNVYDSANNALRINQVAP